MSHDQHPFRIFRPAVAVPWLPQVLDSIEGLFRRVMPTWLRLHDIETADLPTASDANLGGLAYDTTDDRLTYSTGAAWAQVMPYNAGAALTRTDDTNITLTLGGSPSTALLAATSLTLGWTGTLAVARGGTGAATAADARTNLGLGTIATQAASNVTITGGSITGITTLLGGNGSAQMVMTMNGGSTGGAFRGQRAAVNHWFVGDTAAALGSGAGLIHYVYGSNPILFYTNGVLRATIDATGLDVVGLLRCDSFRIDQTPTTETIVCDKTITISANGTNIKIPCL